ncbi:thioredoxin family protein [Clostridium gasigenes]|uniref:thioredoxin family protein n=1 Tax=Clostridium gasigenes TaxID=94869 RepID=UPI001C0D99E9|nr:thioredoxin family protein [Clostridium gasigenes]MBU3106112.1 thioredoxin family protein [Clostridium gasigenes]
MRIGKYSLIILLSISVVLSIIIYNTTNHHQDKQNMVNEDIQTNEINYDYFTTKIDDINKLINNEIVGYVYFGRDTCPLCLEFNKNLEKEFNQNKNLSIYKFDTDYWREDKDFKNILNKYSISEIPMLIKIDKDQSYKIFIVTNVEETQSELNNFLYD